LFLLFVFFKLKEGSKVNLPLWLARELFKYRIVDISTGSLFDDKVRANLQADPTDFSMHRHPYFYELGLFLSSL
jgi:GINS complex subunit 3